MNSAEIEEAIRKLARLGELLHQRMQVAEQDISDLHKQFDKQGEVLTRIEGFLELIRLEIERIAGEKPQTWRN